MKYREQILEEFSKVPENTLIMTGKLYRDKFAEKMGEAAFSQAICRLCKSNEIERISKGIYCRPKKTRFGVVLPSDKEIVDWFTNQGNGIIVGYDLYNSLGITTQVSKRVTAYSIHTTGEGERAAFTYSIIDEDGNVIDQNKRMDLVLVDPDILDAAREIKDYLLSKIPEDR